METNVSVVPGTVLDALGDRTRRALVELLGEAPAAVAELADRVPVSRPAVSQHLRVLLDAGLVDYDTHGTRNVYRLEPAGFGALRRWLDGFWDEVLGEFATFARNEASEEER